MWQNSMNSSYTPDCGGPLKYPCLRHCVQVSPSILAKNTILKIYPQIWHGSSMYARMWIPLPFRVWDWMLRISTRPRTYRHVRTMIATTTSTTTATEFTYVHECHLWFLTGNNDLNAFRIHQSGIASRGVWQTLFKFHSAKTCHCLLLTWQLQGTFSCEWMNDWSTAPFRPFPISISSRWR